MLLQRLYDPKLAQSSYLIACPVTREAIVIDPMRDVERYLSAAAALGVRVRHVTETHIHADFVSGSRELAKRAGAVLYLSDEGGADWRYDYAASTGAVLLHEGDELSLGVVRLKVIHTPGHTPEHLTFLVTDGAAATEPIGAVTGDFVFVGDVGRPDLLERAAAHQGTMDASARTLFRSLQRFKTLPDWLQIWPGHGAGSACGKGLSAIPHSTVGYERRFNWAFAVTDEDEFVRLVLSGQPDPPRYFGAMKRINKEGPALLHGLPRPPVMPPGRLSSLMEERGLIVDLRPAAEFAAGHVPGTLNIPLNNSFTSWAGWLLPYDRDFFLLADGAEPAAQAVRDLATIGMDRVAGVFDREAVSAWSAAGCPLATVGETGPAELARLLHEGSVTALDVRTRAEWERGHIPGTVHIPLGDLPARGAELPNGRPLVVHCQGGSRSAIAASLLQAQGRTEVLNLLGGFAEWERAGQPVEKEGARGD